MVDELNLINGNLTPWRERILFHIIPASAPTGVMNAPRLEPTTAP